MIYIIVFVVAFALGYLFAMWGAVENLKKGNMFILKDGGKWFPYDPTVKTMDFREWK